MEPSWARDTSVDGGGGVGESLGNSGEVSNGGAIAIGGSVIDNSITTTALSHTPGRLVTFGSLGTDEEEKLLEITVASPRLFTAFQHRERSVRRKALSVFKASLMKVRDTRLLLSFAPRCMNLRAHCPFEDVRKMMAKILESMKKKRFIQIPELPPLSHFFSEQDLPRSAAAREALTRAFLGSGRVSNFDLLLTLKTEYMVNFQETLHMIMREPGPLPIHMRHFIAIMASARYRCVNITRWQEQEFLLAGGAMDWLLYGVSAAPTKVQNLLPLCEVLAHQPWLISADHFEPLIKGSDAWTTSEIVHAMVVMVTFFGISRLSYAGGLLSDVDMSLVYADALANENREVLEEETRETSPAEDALTTADDDDDDDDDDDENDDDDGDEEEDPQRRLNSIEDDSVFAMDEHETTSSSPSQVNSTVTSPAPTGGDAEFTANIAQRLRADTGEREVIPDEAADKRVKLFCEADDVSGDAVVTSENVAKAAAAEFADKGGLLSPVSGGGTTLSDESNSALHTAAAGGDIVSVDASSAESAPLVRIDHGRALTNTIAANIDRYRGEHNLQHADFDVHSKQYGISRAQDYCWPDHGFDMVSHFLPEIAGPLDELFSTTQAMTDNKLFTYDQLDTMPIRQAIWQYVQRSKGYLHDDYAYQNINTYLNVSIKKFLKLLVSHRELLQWTSFNSDFGYSIATYEKIHMAILAIESSKQAELLYGLKAMVKNRG